MTHYYKIMIVLLLKDVLIARPEFSKKRNFIKVCGGKTNKPIEEFISNNENNFKLSNTGIV